MFKKVMYRNDGYPVVGQEFVPVVYVVKGTRCYFSGTVGRGYEATSTINAASEIVQAIAAQEGVPVSSLRFFDLLTHHGYDRPAGVFDFCELVIECQNDDIHVCAWNWIECPDEITEFFRDYIGVAPDVKIWQPAEAIKADYLPTKKSCPTLGGCLQFIQAQQERSQLFERLGQSSPRTASIAKELLGPPNFERLIVVDARSEQSTGDRYVVWSRDRTPEN